MRDIDKLYPTLHKASEEKFVDTVNRMIRKKNPPTRLQAQRKIIGYSQRELAEKVGINLRTLQQYEIRAKDINKAAGVTLLCLIHVQFITPVFDRQCTNKPKKGKLFLLL